MKRVWGTFIFSLAAATAVLAQPYYVGQTGTIQRTGPRTGTFGDNFMNVEGDALTTFSSYAVMRWDLTVLKSNLNLQFGVNNWRITGVDLALVQSNIAQSATGDVRTFYTTDDTTDIKTTAGGLTYPFQNTPGVPDLPVNLADPVASWTYSPVNGQEDVYNLYTDGQGGEKLAMATDIQTDVGNKLTLVIEDVTTTVVATYRGQNGIPTAHPPELRFTVVPIVGNPPTANAGPDQTVTDPDNNGVENVLLDGTASHPNPPATSIVSYEWREGTTLLATGVSPTVSFALGAHTVVLTVTDNFGGTSSDSVLINFPIYTIARAGDNAIVTANACDGTASVTLDGTGSTYNAGTITSYTWTNDYDGSAVASTASTNVSLGVGSHTFRLHIVGSGGETDDDVRTIDVRPAGIFAGHDFDALFANFVNIVPSGPFTSAGDGFGVLSRSTGSVPFGLADDSLSSFAGDVQGVVNDKKLDAWFGSIDLQNNDNLGGTGTADFSFTITGRSNVKIAIDMGAMGNFEATGNATNVPDEYTFSAVVDGGTPITVFTVRANEGPTVSYRLGSGTVAALLDPLWVDGTTNLTNILRTFTFPLNVTGDNLTLSLAASTNGDDEAFVFDNILLYECTGGGDPCPCAGDVNGDGLRDINDLTLFLSAFGLPATNCADVNGDGVVDINDLTLFLSGFGVPCP